MEFKDVCKTEAPESKTCVFPFKYQGHTYKKCTEGDSNNGKAWCAYDIQPGTEVPQDGKHWGDCSGDCLREGIMNDCQFI